MIIGLTGGIACGKSTVARMLVERGAHLVDADVIAREVVLPGSPVLDEVVRQFGQPILNVDGSLNRKKLGAMIFHDDQAKRKLEAILHPPIRKILRERMEHLEQEHPKDLVVVDIPLLYESGLDSMFEEIMVVYIPRQLQLERLMQRDHIDQVAAEARLRSQWPIEEKLARGDVIIDNSGSLHETRQQIDQFWYRKGLL